MLQDNRWSFRNFVSLVVWKRVIIGMEVLDEKLESALRAGFNNIEVICMRCIGCAVNVRAIKTIIDLNRRDMNEWMMPWKWQVRVNTPDLPWTREVW
jgi:hypothetical protein